MDMLSEPKKVFLKRFVMAALISVPLLLSACASTSMIAKDTKPVLATKPDKAVLVIVRNSALGYNWVVNNYLDGKMIGQTLVNAYFMTDVNPGQHYVIARDGMSTADKVANAPFRSRSTSTARINFEAGRIYFLKQGIYPAFTTVYHPMTTAVAKKEIEEATYHVYNAQRPGENLSEEEYKTIKDDFERENTKDPSHYKEFTTYRGYRIVN